MIRLNSIKIVYLVLLTMVGALTRIPEDLLCCSPDMGAFDGDVCWDEPSNKTTPLRLDCPSFSAVSEEYFNFTVTETDQVFHISEEFEPWEAKRGEVCFASETNPETNETLKMLIICTSDESHEETLGYCILVSAVFLLLTMVVYAALPEIRDLQGKSIINFCGSMGIGLAILTGTKLVLYEKDLIFCSIRGFLTYFFLVASFFWTNAISIQVLLSLRRPVVNNYSWKAFSWYALYAWGCPTVLTVCMAIVNFHPGDHRKPGIGFNNCWFYTYKEQWYYMYSVMAILIVANICIFVYISIHLWRVSFPSSHVKALKYKFIMTLRMFIIMGVTWIFEMISSLTEANTIWRIIDVFNALQGPLIFLLLVVFRKRVLKALLRRGYLFCLAGPVERYLAVKEDDEEGVIQHTIDVTLNERNVEKNGI